MGSISTDGRGGEQLNRQLAEVVVDGRKRLLTKDMVQPVVVDR